MGRLLHATGSVSFRRWAILLLVSISLVCLMGGTSLQSWERMNNISGKFSSFSFVAREQSAQGPESTPASVVPVHQELLSSNNLTEDVQWDEFSLVVKGQRVFILYVIIVYTHICAKCTIIVEANSIRSACLYLHCGWTFFRNIKPPG
jgi:hypothetical protein